MIVLLRPILVNVTAIVAQQPAQATQGVPGRGNNPAMNGGPMPNKPQDANGQNGAIESPEMSPEELDAARTREITAKAMTGILVLLLKWLRLSRKFGFRRLLAIIWANILSQDVLKFEYLTQLLLDSNYVPLVLKLFAHQDIQQVVDSKTDRVEHRYV